LSIEDLLLKDPRPKTTPTLFSDEDEKIHREVPPLPGRRWVRPIQQLSFGEPKFCSTKALIVYVCDPLTEANMTRPPISFFAHSLLELLSLALDDLKSIVGDANENHLADFLVKAVLSFVDFGSDWKNVEGAKTVDDSFLLVFRLLSSDIFATITLAALQQQLDSL
jgi:hypothetical protein